MFDIAVILGGSARVVNELFAIDRFIDASHLLRYNAFGGAEDDSCCCFGGEAWNCSCCRQSRNSWRSARANCHQRYTDKAIQAK